MDLIISVQHTTTKNGDPMLVCGLADGRRAYIFKDMIGLLARPGYVLPPRGGTHYFSVNPIEARVVESNGYVRVMSISPDAILINDPPTTFDVEIARRWACRSLAQAIAPGCWVIDTETSGLNFPGDELLSFAAQRLGTTVGIYTLIRPDPLTPAHTRAAGVHGLTADRLGNAPRLVDIQGSMSCLHGSIVLGFNVNFDVRMILATFMRYGLTPPVIAGVIDLKTYTDVYFIAQDGTLPTLSLSDTAARLGIETPDAHDALADVRTTILVANTLIGLDKDT